MPKKTAAQRKAAAEKKVRQLVKKGYRLNDNGKTSSTYKSAAAQKKMGSYKTQGTGHSAAKTAKRASRAGRKK